MRPVIGRTPMNLTRDWTVRARSVSRNGRIPSARREMIEYLISRTMGNQRRHTASLLAVQSVRPSVRPSVCPTCNPWASKAAGASPVSDRSIREYTRLLRLRRGLAYTS